MPLGEVISIADGIDYTYIIPFEIKMLTSDWSVQKTIYVSTNGSLNRTINNINHCDTLTLQITYP